MNIIYIQKEDIGELLKNTKIKKLTLQENYEGKGYYLNMLNHIKMNYYLQSIILIDEYHHTEKSDEKYVKFIENIQKRNEIKIENMCAETNYDIAFIYL